LARGECQDHVQSFEDREETTNKYCSEEGEAKEKQAQQEAEREEKAFPSRCFAIYDATNEDEPDVKGTVLVLSRSERLAVTGYVLRMDNDGRALLVLRGAQNQDSLFVALCPTQFIPREIVKKPQASKVLKKLAEWEPIEIDSVPVRRNQQALQHVTCGPFKGRTCDEAMVASLQSGLVMTRSATRPEFVVYRLPFSVGSLLPSTSVYSVGEVNGVMCLQHPGRLSGVPEQVLSLAKDAKNALPSNSDNKLFFMGDSVSSILNHMESFSSCAESFAADRRLHCLNVALGGPPRFEQYGRFVPCKVSLKSFPFTKGSFTATPCSCDIEFDKLTAELKNVLKKMRKGHESSSGKKRKATG
jgi:hypothetical protein